MPTVAGCDIVLCGRRMEEVKVCYPGTVLSKHGEMEGEITERVVQGRSVTGALTKVMKGGMSPKR